MRIIILIFSFFICNVFAMGQSVLLSASIDQKCNAVPSQLNIPSTLEAGQFEIISLKSGNNCYNGSSFKERGFLIKNSNGELVFKYSISDEGKVEESPIKLKDLKIKPGIYMFYVDGGHGAKLEIKCYLE